MFKNSVDSFSDERIATEGEKDGERNIPEMGSYMPAQFEQALIAHGEQEVQKVYKEASHKIAKIQPIYQTHERQLKDLESHIQPIQKQYDARKKELGRDVTISFPPKLHVALILFLGIGEFPLNTVVFRLFGEPEYLTYIMASTLAVTIPLLGLFVGMHLRYSIPRVAGNILIGIATPLAVGATLFAISILRNMYIFSQFSEGGAGAPVGNENSLAFALFALNGLVFFAALLSSYFAHDPDEKLDFFRHRLSSLDRKKERIRSKLFEIGTKINGEIQKAKSQIEGIRALSSERVALYRRMNLRARSLLPPPSFRKNPEFPSLNFWPEVSLNGDNGSHDE